jgi:hypothetical protein
MSTERWITEWECKDTYSQHNLIELIGDNGIMFCTRCRWRDYVDICIGTCKMAIDPRDKDIDRDTLYVWHSAC